MLILRTKHLLQTKPTTMREPITPEEKPAISLRHLATGESYKSFMYQYYVNNSTILKLVPVVCNVISKMLIDEFMCFPPTENNWLKKATEFE